MNAKYLIFALVVVAWTGVAAAAIKFGHPEPVLTAPGGSAAVARIEVSAKRVEPPVARVVVTARRSEAPQTVAAR